MPEDRELGGGKRGGGEKDVGGREGAILLRTVQEVRAESGAVDRHIPISRQVEKTHEESEAERVLEQAAATAGVPDLNLPCGLSPEKVFSARFLCIHEYFVHSRAWGLGLRV
jgi:hypothetical protein